MNYQHAYHAGSFADVFKHILLIALLDLLKQKPTPFCYLDTHAGCGYYDLEQIQTSKTKEYLDGIIKTIRAENPPALIQRYLDYIHTINKQLGHPHSNSLRYYPGSPLIAQHALRPQDRMVACELQSDAYRSLRAALGGRPNVALHHMDGYLGLKAFLPPKERRGIILIDPPYESTEELAYIGRQLSLALQRFPMGIFALWYPIKDRVLTERFINNCHKTIKKTILVAELTIYPNLPQYLNGCGLAIVNPPWKLDKTFQTVMPWLWKALTINDQGGQRIFTLE